MKIYAPKYYKDFICIADKCKHSCCVGWEIDVDCDTMKKYREYKGNYSDEIIESVTEGDEPCFKLDKNERCPHLDEKGLCKIILNVGEDYLCHICREHPRFYNDSPQGREVGLGMACEEACRIILNSDSGFEICEIGETNEENCCPEFNSLEFRQRIYEILCDESMEYCDKLSAIGNSFGVPINFKQDAEWRLLIDKLEYMDETHKSDFLKFTADADVPRKKEKMLERALAYFVYRHCAEVWNLNELRASVGFCLFCERLLASLVNNEEDIFEWARILSEEIEYSEENTEMIKDTFYSFME